MAIKTTMTFTKPSTDITWFEPSDAFKTYNKATYVDTGKRTLVEEIESEDGLSKTFVTIMADSETVKTYTRDSNIQGMLNARDLYCIQNNISLTREQEEV
ncbi:uncharacterized protein METZ01_LOCUS465375 [marine metagenome]|uniref:Uncharacterized protein n=1 Tax=marine metagenome TaxID=408172 RepID=A0A383AY08_9ZZZZ